MLAQKQVPLKDPPFSLLKIPASNKRNNAPFALLIPSLLCKQFNKSSTVVGITHFTNMVITLIQNYLVTFPVQKQIVVFLPQPYT